MCGIFGWVTTPGEGITEWAELARSCFKALHHRGPDDHGLMHYHAQRGWSEEINADYDRASLLLGHVRLSILDLSSLGRQPMVTNDGRFRLVFNGEIYNYRELRRQLEGEGISFRTQTDTEVVLNAFAKWGLKCLNMFTGMFAMAIHDNHDKKLYLIRDHFGVKPLYYTLTSSGKLFFASELPALLGLPGVSKTVSSQRAYDYLLFSDYDSLKETMVEGIYHLLPGHYMAIDSNSGNIIETKRYWDLDLNSKCDLSFSGAADKVRSMFIDSVRLHLRSDVPLGTALSGGVDSSAVTCVIRHLEPDMVLPSFTYVASGSDVNEEKWADRVASHVNSEAHKVHVEPAEMVSDIDKLVKIQGEPFGGTSIYAQLRVFRLARDSGVKVTLDGQGADELLAGYIGFPGERIKSLIMSGDILGAWRFFSATTQWPDRNKLDVFKRVVGVFSPGILYPFLRALGKGTLSPEWINTDYLNDCRVSFDIPRVEKIYNSRSYVRNELARQLTQRGLPALLRHGDRNSMHYSIESRVPFLTREIAEFMMSLPEEYLIAPDGTTKAIFRKAMRGIVPDEILDRRDKIGFATPEKNWLKLLSPWVEEQLHDAKELPIFNVTELQKEWQEILAGRKNFDARVWRWLNLIRWTKLFNLQFT